MSHQIPRSSYIYEVHKCNNVKQIEKVFKENKDRIGFYPYMIPQAEGMIFIVATTNPAIVMSRFEKQVIHGLKILEEGEAEKLTREFFQESFLATKLYDEGYVLAKRIDEKLKEAKK